MPKSNLPPDSSGQGPAGPAERYRRSLLKLFAAYAGQHAELDRRLRSLNNLVRRSPEDESLPGLFENAVDVLIGQGLTEPRPGSATARLAELLGQSSGAGPVPEHTRHLRTRLRDASSREEVDRALVEVAALINSLAERQPVRQTTAGETADFGLLDALLDELQLAPESMATLAPLRDRLHRSQTRPAQVDAARQLGIALSGILKAAASAHAAAGDDLALARNQLQHLLDNLTLPQPFAADRSQLRQQLVVAGNPQEMQSAVDGLLELLDRARGNTRQEMEELSSFLKVVARRIEEFKGQVSQSGEAHDAAIESANSLQREMADQMADVCGALNESQDLDAVKPTVMSQLKELESSLGDFVRTEQTRHGSASAQMELVVARLRELEGETQRLRSDLDGMQRLGGWAALLFVAAGPPSPEDRGSSSEIRWFSRKPLRDSSAPGASIQAPSALPIAFQVHTVPGSTASLWRAMQRTRPQRLSTQHQPPSAMPAACAVAGFTCR